MTRNFFEALRDFDTEWIVLVTLLVVSSYMFWTAGRYSDASAEFPRITSGIILILGTVVVTSKVLGFELPGGEPSRRESIEDLDELEGVETEGAREQAEGAAAEEESQSLDEYIDDVRTLAILSGLVLLYTIAILSVGLIVSSFLFVVLYAIIWKRMKWYEVAVLLAATTAILWMFQTQLNIELNRTFFDTGYREFAEDFMDWLPVATAEAFGESGHRIRDVIKEAIR